MQSAVATRGFAFRFGYSLTPSRPTAASPRTPDSLSLASGVDLMISLHVSKFIMLYSTHHQHLLSSFVLHTYSLYFYYAISMFL
jgi:hypothetical protein